MQTTLCKHLSEEIIHWSFESEMSFVPFLSLEFCVSSVAFSGLQIWTEGSMVPRRYRAMLWNCLTKTDKDIPEKDTIWKLND